MRRGKKLARELRRRIVAWENMSKGANTKAYRKPGAHPGDYSARYGG